MALSKIDAANFLTGTIPSGNIATSSLAAAATGKVLQVVQAEMNSNISTTANSYVDTGLNANITPSSTSNKILVQVSHNGVLKYTGASALGVKIKLFKDTTELDVLSVEAAWNNTSAYQDAGAVTCDYLDSPNTTSQINYKTTFAAANTSGTNVAIGSAGSLSTIVLMEIEA